MQAPPIRKYGGIHRRKVDAGNMKIVYPMTVIGQLCAGCHQEECRTEILGSMRIVFIGEVKLLLQTKETAIAKAVSVLHSSVRQG